MHAHGLAGRKETNTGVKVDAGGLVSVVNRGGGPPLDKGVGAMEAGGVGRARGMGMSSSDRRGQLMRERERAGAWARWHVGQWRQWRGALMQVGLGRLKIFDFFEFCPIFI
jgi:hypothetical protein